MYRKKMLHKEVTERPRARNGGREVRYYGDLEEAPKSESIRGKWLDRKEFTDVLGPLYGFLRSKVGQRWDDVYSELSQKLPKTSLQYIHIWGHIESFVETKVIEHEGKIYYQDGSSMTNHELISTRSKYETLYVHPTTGILCAMPCPERKKYKVPKKLFQVNGKHYIWKNGWFELITKPYVAKTREELITAYGNRRPYTITREVPQWDAFLNRYVTFQNLNTTYGKDLVICVSKRQINSWMIKKLKLNELWLAANRT